VNKESSINNQKLPGIFRKQNSKLIILFTVTSVLLFSLIFGTLSLTYHLTILEQSIDWNVLLHLPEICNLILVGLFAGIVFTIFGLFYFNTTTIVNLIRLFIITFIVLFTIIYISLRAI